ncbi:MAG: DUF962 domain-containing protein [Planctomycetes bacterium]|nr:DUF962 domain-containing protein [Planctomycetota bacterium]
MPRRKVKETNTFSDFRDFWRHYLDQHQHPINQNLHIVGTLCGSVCLFIAIMVSIKWLLAAIFLGYGFAWLGHFLFEKNKPLTIRYPVWSILADHLLVAQKVLRASTFDRLSSSPQTRPKQFSKPR